MVTAPAIASSVAAGQPMKLVIGSDHAGFPLKGPVIELLRSWGHSVNDVGTDEDFRRRVKKLEELETFRP